MVKYVLYFMVLAMVIPCHAQDTLKTDTIQKTVALDQVTVTATRTGRLMGSEPMPVLSISKRQIANSGSLRLTDILSEQTGLTIVHDPHGTGLQLQGFNPDYTLILIDGEPAIGRTSGIFDLDRITVNNIRSIEVVKGPASCLYGSDALAGVVNIITQNPDNTAIKLSARYGTNQTSDLGTNFSLKTTKTGLSLFFNRYQTNGYDLSPSVFGKTVDPHVNYTINPRFVWNISNTAEFVISAKYFDQVQHNASQITDESSNNTIVSGDGKELDFSLLPYLKFSTGSKVKNTLRYYISGYKTRSELFIEQNHELYDKTFFTQYFNRPELQTDISFNSKNVLTTGLGYIAESVEATRYDNKKILSTRYAFLQFDSKPIEKLNIVGGLRFDDHNEFSPRLSPKFSARYDINEQFALLGSIGTGYKTPDFRQMYLNFTNAVVGYSVFGAKEVEYYINKLSENGEISYLYADLSRFGNLKPESSLAFNLGLKFKRNNTVNCDINLFRNNVKDLIESQMIALRTNGSAIYSYTNLHKVFTQGFEMNTSYKPFKYFTFSSGYQYLMAKDEDVVEKINNGIVFRRNPVTMESEKVKLSEYGGLFNRSKHTWNVKLFYDNYQTGTSASLRAIYRGRFGFADNNSNAILDADSEYAKGYLLLNVSASQVIKKTFRVQLGCDNLTGHTDPVHTPGLSGRLFYLATSYTFEINKNQNN